MRELLSAGTLKKLARLPLAGVGIVYLFGFVIVSIFDGTYGIADFSLFRAKVIAVGAVFVTIVGISVVVTFRMFSLMGLTFDRHGVPPSSIVVVTAENKFLVIADRALAFPYSCFGLVYPLVFLFNKPPPITGLLLIAPAAWAALSVIERKYFSTHPLRFVFLSALNTVGFLIVLFKYADREYFWFVVWFSSICGFTVYLYFKMIEPDAVRNTEWERVFMFAVPVIFGLYAAKVYPGIKPQFGGGAPVPIVLHLTKKLPVFDSESVSVSLVDETTIFYGACLALCPPFGDIRSRINLFPPHRMLLSLPEKMGRLAPGGKSSISVIQGFDNSPRFLRLKVMAKKNGKMTLDKIARMVERGFEKTQEEVNRKIDEVDNHLEAIFRVAVFVPEPTEANWGFPRCCHEMLFKKASHAGAR